MSEQITEADTIDPQTGMSPREAAEAVVKRRNPAQHSRQARDASVERVLFDGFRAGSASYIPGMFKERKTIANWHARQSAALLERIKALKDAGTTLYAYVDLDPAVCSPESRQRIAAAIAVIDEEQPR